MKTDLRNLYLVFRDQLPLSRLLRNLWRGNLRGILHIRSHVNNDGSPKVKYNTKASAAKAAQKMTEKRGTPFGHYKCLHCTGYHVGKNRSTWNIVEKA